MFLSIHFFISIISFLIKGFNIKISNWIIGKSNISMKQIAFNVGISYDQLRHRKSEMVSRNGFGTFLGFYHAFITEEIEKE